MKSSALSKRVFALAVLVPSLFLNAINQGNCQTPSPTVDQYVASGEFPLAITQAQSMPATIADQSLKTIAMAQMMSGAPQGAWLSAGRISDDRQRSNTLGGMFQPQESGTNGGQTGGVTIADFQPLINLIQTTIAPDEWSDTGTGDGTIQAYPAGVFVDASGTLRRIQFDATGKLEALRRRTSANDSRLETSQKTELRTISLVALEREAQLSAAQGKPISAWMKNLGGMYDVQYLIAKPESNDLLIAGPAGPWHLDNEGRAINTETGKPVLQLDDLVICMRNAVEKNGVFGCAITPRKENLASAKEFLATSKLKGTAWRTSLRNVLGQQDVEVFGIPADTHTASVLLEADLRMKLVGMGIEPSIPEIPSYLERVKLLPDGSVPPMDVARWWFTLNYDDLTSDPDRLIFAFQGTGVKVLSETEFVSEQGDRIHTGQSQGPTKLFAEDFTRHFDKIAAKYPVYEQLRGVFDLALVAGIMQKEQLVKRVNWHVTYFGAGDDQTGLRYKPRHSSVARQVDSVMNHRMIRARGEGKTLQHTIVGVSGGVHCDFGELLKDRKYTEGNDSIFGEVKSHAAAGNDSNSRWWWD